MLDRNALSTLERRAVAKAWLRQHHPRLGPYAHKLIDGEAGFGEPRYRNAGYGSARVAALSAITYAGGHVRRGVRNRLIVVWQSPPEGTRPTACNWGLCYVY